MNQRESGSSSSTPVTKPAPQENPRNTEIDFRHFIPENSRDVAALHAIDLDTRDTTVDVTRAQGAITTEDLEDWMRDPSLYAVIKNGQPFGFVWFTEDTNIEHSQTVRELLVHAGMEAEESMVQEFNNGERGGIQESDVLEGWRLVLTNLRSTHMGDERKLIVTAYTSDDAEGIRFEMAGFKHIGNTPRYYAKMDDGSVDIIEQLHRVYALITEHDA